MPRTLGTTLALASTRLARSVAPLLLLALVLSPLALAGDAIAQANPVAPPAPGDIRGGFPVWIAYVSILFLTAAVMVVGLFPSKRGHQD